MNRHFGEAIPAREWAPDATDARLVVGGRTVWVGTPEAPALVSQPNRWGQAVEEFPDVSCIVEVDPAISGCLRMPEEVIGWVDRRHRPVEPPTDDDASRGLPARARRLAKVLGQVRGVSIVAEPTARTVAFTLPIDGAALIRACAGEGVTGLRALTGMAGAVAAVVGPGHSDDDFDFLAGLTAASL